MKYDLVEIYRGRLEEIDKQIFKYVHKKEWNMVKQLREEKKSIMVTVKELEG